MGCAMAFYKPSINRLALLFLDSDVLGPPRNIHAEQSGLNTIKVTWDPVLASPNSTVAYTARLEYTVVSGYKPWARSAWQRDNTGSGT